MHRQRPGSAASLSARLAYWAESRPDALAFAFLGSGGAPEGSLTYRELHRQAMAIRGQLCRNDLAGRPVILIYPPGLDYIAAFCGCLHAGAIAVPAPYLLPRRAGERIAAICEAANPAAVLTVSALADQPAMRDAAAALGRVPWIATDRIDVADAAHGGPVEVETSSPAFLQFTSGSTSTPKGVVVSHGNLSANMAMIQEAFGHDERTRFVSWLPMFHDMGLVGCVLQPIHLGCACVTMSPLAFLQKPVRWLQAIARYGGTTSGAPNFAYDLCLRSIDEADCAGLDLRCWQVAFCGAEPIRPDTLTRFARRFAPYGLRAAALYPCYGLSEATLFVSGGPPGGGMRTATLDPPAADPRPARVVAGSGRGAAGQQVVIVDPETLRPVAAGAIGEIWLAGPHVSQGYWAQPEATAATFGGVIAGDDRRFLRTGDLGFWRDGDLYVTGRLKDLVIVRGTKHHPEDIEATAARSHAALAGGSGAVFTTDIGDDERLIIVLEVDRRHIPGLDIGAVTRAAATSVTRDHGIRPHDIRLVRPGCLPRTTSGKIRRRSCRSAYLAGGLPSLPGPPSPPSLPSLHDGYGDRADR